MNESTPPLLDDLESKIKQAVLLYQLQRANGRTIHEVTDLAGTALCLVQLARHGNFDVIAKIHDYIRRIERL